MLSLTPESYHLRMGMLQRWSAAGRPCALPRPSSWGVLAGGGRTRVAVEPSLPLLWRACRSSGGSGLGLTCHLAESRCLRMETRTLPKCTLQSRCFLSVLGFFFFFLLFTSSAYIIIRSKLFILVLFLIEVRKSIYRTVKPEGRLKWNSRIHKASHFPRKPWIQAIQPKNVFIFCVLAVDYHCMQKLDRGMAEGKMLKFSLKNISPSITFR